MDIISQLSDGLLLRVLSFVPTEDVVDKSLLSKRWRFLWRLVPHLEYNDTNISGDYKSFYQFVYRSLLSNKAPVLKNLHLKLADDCPVIDIGLWIDIAVSRRLRKLEIDFRSSKEDSVTLPSSLYTSNTLETLILIKFVLLNVPFSVCLPSLKVLRLKQVDYLDNTSIPSLLSGCSNLEDLVLERHPRDETADTTVVLPSLQRLSMIDLNFGKCDRFVINCSSLKYLNIKDYMIYNLRQIENMPELVEAHVRMVSTICLLSQYYLTLLTDNYYDVGLRNMILVFVGKKPRFVGSLRVVFPSVCCLVLRHLSRMDTKGDKEIERCQHIS